MEMPKQFVIRDTVPFHGLECRQWVPLRSDEYDGLSGSPGSGVGAGLIFALV